MAECCAVSHERDRETIAESVPRSCRYRKSKSKLPERSPISKWKSRTSLSCSSRQDYEYDQRRAAPCTVELALRDAAVRSGAQNISGGLGGNGRGAHSFTFILRAATMDVCRDHRSGNAGKTFPFDLEPTPDSGLLT